MCGPGNLQGCVGNLAQILQPLGTTLGTWFTPGVPNSNVPRPSTSGPVCYLLWAHEGNLTQATITCAGLLPDSARLLPDFFRTSAGLLPSHGTPAHQHQHQRTSALSWDLKGQEQQRAPRAGEGRPLCREASPELHFEVNYLDMLSISSLMIYPSMCGSTLAPASRSNQGRIMRPPASMASNLPRMMLTPEGRGVR